jgi:hypothetical protein
MNRPTKDRSNKWEKIDQASANSYISLVVVQCRANVEALLCSVVPGLVCRRICMDKHSAAHEGKKVLMKSNGPLKYSQADIFGLIVAWHSKLTVNLAWGKRRPQRYGGNVASTPERMESEWFLKCCIIHLALFLRCMSSSTSWNLVFHVSVMNCLKSVLASLSLILRSTKSPQAHEQPTLP